MAPATDSSPEPYLVLARRLRPARFGDVLGQEHVTRSLQSALTTGRLAHAYLFCGARGVGKTTVARILARALNCQSFPAPEPCGDCPSCAEMASGQPVDFIEIDGASNRGIAEIRELRESVRYLPASGRYKVYLIDEVHMLTEPAFNALLKTLEEPPPHVVFIFATTAPHKVPATILSRCQRYDFRRLPEEMIAAELARISAAEGRELESEAAALIAREAEGSMRDALSLLEQVFAGTRRYLTVSDSGTGRDAVAGVTAQLAVGDAGAATESAGQAAEVSVSDESITAAQVASALGLIDRRLVSEAFAAVAAADAARLLEVAAEVHGFGQDAQHFCQLLLQQVRDAMAARLLADRPEALIRLVRATPDELAELKRQAENVSQETLQLYFDILMEGLARIRRSTNPRLTLEMTLLRLATLEPAVPLDEILGRLARLEERLAQSGGGVAAEGQRGLFGEAEPAAPPPRPAAPLPVAASAGATEGGRVSERETNEVPKTTREPAPEGPSHASEVLERVHEWAKENDGKLFAALGGGAALEGQRLLIPPGFFKAEDIQRRAAACLEALGLGLEVRIAQAGAGESSPRKGPRRATLQDVYNIFGTKPTQQ